MPVDPAFALTGPEFRIDGVGPAAPAEPAAAGGFANMLGDALGSVQRSQEEAAAAARDLATGRAADPTAVVMAVERAQLSMQLAAQIRTKAVEAAQDIFHTQV